MLNQLEILFIIFLKEWIYPVLLWFIFTIVLESIKSNTLINTT